MKRVIRLSRQRFMTAAWKDLARRADSCPDPLSRIDTLVHLGWTLDCEVAPNVQVDIGIAASALGALGPVCEGAALVVTGDSYGWLARAARKLTCWTTYVVDPAIPDYLMRHPQGITYVRAKAGEVTIEEPRIVVLSLASHAKVSEMLGLGNVVALIDIPCCIKWDGPRRGVLRYQEPVLTNNFVTRKRWQKVAIWMAPHVRELFDEMLGQDAAQIPWWLENIFHPLPRRSWRGMSFRRRIQSRRS